MADKTSGQVMQANEALRSLKDYNLTSSGKSETIEKSLQTPVKPIAQTPPPPPPEKPAQDQKE